MLPHRIRLASFGGIGAETYAKLLCVDTTIEGMLYGVLVADSASGIYIYTYMCTHTHLRYIYIYIYIHKVYIYLYIS
jgi:hypothetical protein